MKRGLDQVEFADNPEPRCALVLLLDTSRSMEGQPIEELSRGLAELNRALKNDKLAALRIEIGVITFGGKVQALDIRGGNRSSVPFDAREVFVTINDFTPPILRTGGDTPMGEAVTKAINMLNERKRIYKANGIDYFRPWILLITDGKPNDSDGYEAAARLAREEQARKAVLFYAVGVKGADMETLAEFTLENHPLPLKGLAFQELFQWLSKSLLAVAQSRPGAQAPLPPVDGWAASGSEQE